MIAGSMYFALGTIYIMRGALNGMGDVFFSMMNGALEIGGRIVFAAIFIFLVFNVLRIVSHPFHSFVSMLTILLNLSF